MSGGAKDYSPEIVAQSFIKQYYDLFARNPGELYRFYKDESEFIHADGHQAAETVHGVENIRERVTQLKLAGAQIDLSEGSVDAQKSDNNGVFLTVTGHVTLLSKPTRPFVQSFLLACQSSVSNKSISYFLRNSVFRLLGAPILDQSRAVSTSPTNISDVTINCRPDTSTQETDVQNITEEPVHVALVDHITEEAFDDNLDDYEEQDGAAEYNQTVNNEEDDDDNDNVVADITEKLEVNEEVVVVPEEDVQEPEVPEVSGQPQAQTPSVLKSFADVVKLLAGPTPVPATSSPPRKLYPKKEKTNPEEFVESVNAAPISQPVKSSGGRGVGGSRDVVGLYVNQIGEDVVENDFKELFGPFGTTTNIDVHALRGYAFVEFTDGAVVKNILAAAEQEPFVLKGRKLKVEERQTGRSRGNKLRGDRHVGFGGVGNGGSVGDIRAIAEGREFVDAKNRGRREGGRGRGGGGRGDGGDKESRGVANAANGPRAPPIKK